MCLLALPSLPGTVSTVSGRGMHLGEDQGGFPWKRKVVLFLLAFPASGSNGWCCPSPVCPWLRRHSNSSRSHFFFFTLGSGQFYSLQLTLHAPKWRNLHTLSISIALGNVLNGIWGLKARYNCPLTKKVMIKAPSNSFYITKSQHSLSTSYSCKWSANQSRANCLSTGWLKYQNSFFFFGPF